MQGAGRETPIYFCVDLLDPRRSAAETVKQPMKTRWHEMCMRLSRGTCICMEEPATVFRRIKHIEPSSVDASRGPPSTE